jgi:hypothetical protein
MALERTPDMEGMAPEQRAALYKQRAAAAGIGQPPNAAAAASAARHPPPPRPRRLQPQPQLAVRPPWPNDQQARLCPPKWQPPPRRVASRSLL